MRTRGDWIEPVADSERMRKAAEDQVIFLLKKKVQTSSRVTGDDVAAACVSEEYARAQ